jgi:hypothetical protein
MNIEDITAAIRSNRIRIADHADEEAKADALSFDEIYLSVFQGEIIEDYPDDKPYPSCLVLGHTFSGDPVQCLGVQSGQWVGSAHYRLPA